MFEKGALPDPGRVVESRPADIESGLHPPQSA
jgi:hypothetical protein